MSLVVIEQRFPLGRFHATRWKQNFFEDPHGEWPPSPWRFLRALAARWAQLRRERGDEDDKPRDALLNALAARLPAFQLPEATWRGTPLRQYVPTKVDWIKNPAFRQPGKTLVPDAYRVISPEDAVYWKWDFPEPFAYRKLLTELLKRMLYFGRAETACLFRLLDDDEAAGIEENCVLLAESGSEAKAPVLVPKLDGPLNLDALLAATDDKLIASRSVPPGSEWRYAAVPLVPTGAAPKKREARFPEDLHVIQFAVGGRVFPPVNRWVKVTERFRGAALKALAFRLGGGDYARLSPEHRKAMERLSGKDADGKPLEGNQHAYFLLWPDEHGLPMRLICYRPKPFKAFTSEEIQALLTASESDIFWKVRGSDKDDKDEKEEDEKSARRDKRFDRNADKKRLSEWTLRLIPLPFSTPAPAEFGAESAVWESATPFVAPGNRKRFRENGRLRPGETSVALLVKLLKKSGFPEPLGIEPMDTVSEERFVAVHLTRQERFQARTARESGVKPGERFRLTFPQPVSGPLCLGHSAHFGLGLFVLPK
jgi:CRISPR-associated protein Csb2